MGTDRDTLIASVTRHLQNHDFGEAAAACQTLCQRFPEFAPGWHKASILAAQVGSLDKADEYIDRAAHLDAKCPAIKLQKIAILIARGQRNDALNDALAVEGQVNVADKTSVAALAVVLSGLDQHERALPWYQALVDAEPDNPVHLFNLAATYRYLGDSDCALKYYDQGLAINPHYFEAYPLRSSLKTQSLASNHIEEIKTLLLDESLPEAGVVHLGFALAKELEDTEQYDESFAALTESNALYRAMYQYEVQLDVEKMQRVKAEFSPAFFAKSHTGHESKAPIFVFGLPRTGTTLVERVLSSHSQVCSAGESLELGNVISELVQPLITTYAANKPSQEHATTRIDPFELGKRYCERARPPGRVEPFFIDKMLPNFMHCGLIGTSMPNAGMIEVRRHPVATCYAIYRHLFNRAYPYSYKLEEIAHYVVAQRRLMAYWHEVMPERILTVHYEHLVQEQALETRRLLAHCGLAWEDQCLHFESNPAAVTTASASQVRQPIYRASLTHWTNYQEQLAPAIEILSAAGLDVEPAGNS